MKGVEEWSKAGTFLRKPEKGWLHSAQNIKDGVSYALKVISTLFLPYFGTQWKATSGFDSGRADCEFQTVVCDDFNS